MADYKIQLTPDLFAEPIELGLHRYPPAVDMRATGKRGAPDVVARFEIRDWNPVTVDFRLTAKPGGRLRKRDLDDWPLQRLAFNVFRRYAQPLAEDPHQLPYGPADADELREVHRELDGALTKRRGPTAAELQEVANVYRENIDGNPTEAVQTELAYNSRGTAARRVQEARAKGLLPPTTPGKRQG